ncbi:GIY-YIG nuclease family protein [Lyngbya sp. PCC 8106]|uniref:GIY-YIG nuclease family protein n=1 Tax=Lyngbya sp. (strain PCC 8106) TaxID=313612 RepID=UPI00090441EF|nr:GIY-YIG nuclease family protein [Lyngbya sp. PCC 8106]
MKIDRDTLLSLITIPPIIKCNNFSDLPENAGIIYFMQEENTLCVKIGHSTGISSRRSNLQTGNPRELHLLGYVEGDKELEKEFHTTYRNFRIEGRREWYYNPPLRYSY